MSPSLGLYLHIPFCEAICPYCNFNRGLLESGLKSRYLEALARDIHRSGDASPVDTIYFGGGTPSLLDGPEVGALLRECRDAFQVSPEAEVTVEVNPETATPARLDGWRDAGVTRLSFGVQSFRDDELRRLGRVHSAERARDAVRLAHDVGFDDVSLDLMLWLPAQTRADARESVESLVALEPSHASLYLLELYPNAPLRDDMARSGWSQAPDEDAAAMYLDALDVTDAAGYEHYEISNVARPGRRCRHNLKYWQDGEWLGFGCGAHSTRRGCRWRNVSETERYVELVDAGGPVVAERRRLTDDERVGDVLFTGLRLCDGLDLAAVERDYGVDVMARFGAALSPFFEADALRLTSGTVGADTPGYASSQRGDEDFRLDQPVRYGMRRLEKEDTTCGRFRFQGRGASACSLGLPSSARSSRAWCWVWQSRRSRRRHRRLAPSAVAPA